MDLISFFRTAIPVTLALFCGVIVFSIIGLFVGNACFVLKNCFKKENSVVKNEVQTERNKKITSRKRKQLLRTLQKAS